MDPQSLAIAAAAIFIGFFVQTVIGFAAGLVAIPILLLVFPIQEAVAFISVYQIVFSIIMVAKTHKDIDYPAFKAMALGVVVGVFCGVITLEKVDSSILSKALAVFILFYIAYSYVKKKQSKIISKLGAFLGFLGGYLSGLFVGGAPAFATYLTNVCAEAHALRATAIVTLAIPNVLRFFLVIAFGMLTVDLFLTSLTVAPALILALVLGQTIFKKLNKAVFKHVVMVFLGLSALMILFK